MSVELGVEMVIFDWDNDSSQFTLGTMMIDEDKGRQSQ